MSFPLKSPAVSMSRGDDTPMTAMQPSPATMARLEAALAPSSDYDVEKSKQSEQQFVEHAVKRLTRQQKPLEPLGSARHKWRNQKRRQLRLHVRRALALAMSGRPWGRGYPF